MRGQILQCLTVPIFSTLALYHWSSTNLAAHRSPFLGLKAPARGGLVVNSALWYWHEHEHELTARTYKVPEAIHEFLQSRTITNVTGIELAFGGHLKRVDQQ